MIGEFKPHQPAPLLGHVTGFRVTGVADDLLEAKPVELAVGSAERRIVGDVTGNLGVGERKAQLAGALVEQKFRDDLA